MTITLSDPGADVAVAPAEHDHRGGHRGDPPGGRLALDPKRVKRALSLTVKPIGTDEWMVSGGQEAHRVRRVAGLCVCKCPDAIYRQDVTCAHSLAVYLHRRIGARLCRILAQLITDASTDRSRTR